MDEKMKEIMEDVFIKAEGVNAGLYAACDAVLAEQRRRDEAAAQEQQCLCAGPDAPHATHGTSAPDGDDVVNELRFLFRGTLDSSKADMEFANNKIPVILEITRKGWVPAGELAKLLCPPHASLDKSGALEPFDNCVACIRAERNELRAEVKMRNDQLSRCQIAARSYADALNSDVPFGEAEKAVLICRQSLDSAIARYLRAEQQLARMVTLERDDPQQWSWDEISSAILECWDGSEELEHWLQVLRARLQQQEPTEQERVRIGSLGPAPCGYVVSLDGERIFGGMTTAKIHAERYAAGLRAELAALKEGK